MRARKSTDGLRSRRHHDPTKVREKRDLNSLFFQYQRWHGREIALRNPIPGLSEVERAVLHLRCLRKALRLLRKYESRVREHRLEPVGIRPRS